MRSPLVLDTNIALDLFVFDDPASGALRTALAAVLVDWLVTDAMREELARVLGYPQIAQRLTRRALAPEAVLEAFDARVCVVAEAPKAPVTCQDADDQKFIDLAVAHRATLISKDAHILRMTKRLARLDVLVRRHWAGEPGRATGKDPSHVAAHPLYS
ncbi:putative toxin-antitoxin system toxin component, PIN family [Hydrogenophaga sp.]|uniref:putative toxin-antitoxin system toxin component, PIN family n=1 Tax=Hydrogenophaga sp. TaxID=1904254 RepID=UPI0025B7FB2E|nr:putative toxin-antitoxin system toxin component, PIN family [Hydrogenophaga sp.]